MDKIHQVMDLLEEITGITYDAPLEWRFPGEKGRLASLEEYLIEILEKKFGIDVKICGYCCNFNPAGITESVREVGHCNKPECPFTDVFFGDQCYFKPSQWIPKEIPEKK